MPNHKYIPEEALSILLRKLTDRDEMLGAAVQTVIDAGRDVSETVPAGYGRRKPRSYRKMVPFTHVEALLAALEVLRGYFVELPLLINSSIENFRAAALSTVTDDLFSSAENVTHAPVDPSERPGGEKDLEIEIQTETRISRVGQETLPLKGSDHQAIDDQLDHLKQLGQLFDFT